MKLVRSDSPDGIGKYALLNIEKYIDATAPKTLETIISTIHKNPKIIEFGVPHSPDEFFVIKLKDKYARYALLAYAYAAETDDPEYAAEVRYLADRAGTCSSYCKTPD